MTEDVVTIERYKAPSRGPGYAWHWGYRVLVPWHKYDHSFGRFPLSDVRRKAKEWARERDASVVESWKANSRRPTSPKNGRL